MLSTIRGDGIVPVFHHDDRHVCEEVASRVVAGGLSTLEFTNRGDGAVERFGHLVDWATLAHPSLILGMGSVVDPSTASHAIDLGACFVFSPSFSPLVAAACHRRGIPYVPGCATPTEMQHAYDHGVDVVKLFPAGELGGPAFLNAVRAPCPWIEAIPTGGVDASDESLRAWFEAGAPPVGMGSKLFPTDLVYQRDWDGVESTIAAAVNQVALARGAAASSEQS